MGIPLNSMTPPWIGKFSVPPAGEGSGTNWRIALRRGSPACRQHRRSARFPRAPTSGTALFLHQMEKSFAFQALQRLSW